jgi:hypothetical protein
MNERIRELVRQAVESVDIVTGNESLDDELAKMYIPDCFSEKFAELIVKETMQVVANQLPGNQYLDVAHAVIEHFGVEEHHAD